MGLWRLRFNTSQLRAWDMYIVAYNDVAARCALLERFPTAEVLSQEQIINGVPILVAENCGG